MSPYQESNRQLMQQRLNRTYIAITLVFLLLAARLWQLQIIQGNEYSLMADRNRVRTIQLVAPRGTIFDRNSIPLVENRSGFNVLLYRESIKDLEATSDFIVRSLGIKPEDLEALLRRNKGTGIYRPIVIKEDVGIDDISLVEAHKREHPEIQLGPEPRRLYRYGGLAAHVFGYVGEISEDEISRETFPGSKSGDLVGRSGVERTYNQVLTGVDGKRRVLVDSIGREVGSLEEQDSVVGGELQLTLDLDLQLVAEDLMQDKVGTIAAMDPRSGEILALTSAPSFDPNSFSTRISADAWNMLVNDPNSPLQNRAIQNAYPPGSIFKLAMAYAGLEEGMIQEDTHVLCTGAASFYNRVFHCSIRRGGHGYLDLESAIARSCNVFFYHLGKRLGISRIAARAQMLGLGERTGIDLPGEKDGLIPSPEWKQEVRGTKWFAGETISVAIGQGQVQVTPLQVLRGASAIATGKLTRPHILLRAEKPVQAVLTVNDSRAQEIRPEVARRIREGMWGSVNNGGTGHNAFVAGLDICGKTGTVQVIGNEKKKELKKEGAAFEDHSWFVGFATRDNPELAVVVFLEHRGKGGVAAAPLAKELFRAYFAKKHRKSADVMPQIAEARR